MSVAHQLQLAATLLLCGLIWTVQLVHYPSFRFVAERDFEGFHSFHSRRISLLVAVLMPVELLATALVLWQDRSTANLVGAGLVILIWASTALLQMPAHRRLAGGFDASALDRLVRTNWIRTLAWSGRGVLVTMPLWVPGS